MRSLFRHSLSLAILMSPMLSVHASALGTMPAKDLPSANGLKRLPSEVRQSAERTIRSCGGDDGTTSAFSRFLQNDRTSLITLHFHASNCLDKNAICDATGCLHQIYVAHGKRYRLVFSQKATEIFLEDTAKHLRATITANGRRFVREF